MIENIMQSIMNCLVWFLFSEKGREWMPFILFINLVCVGSIALWVFTRKDEE
jgi:hypothetical protein